MKLVHVLAIDSNSDRCEGYRHYLSGLQCKVTCVHNGKDALSYFDEHIPDVIILQIQLPDIDGFELSIAIQGHPKLCDVPLIFVSERQDEEEKLRAYSIGGAELFQEPFHVEDLLARFKMILRILSLEKEREAYIHELKDREEKLEVLNKQKDEVLRIVSHDIRSPLSGITGLAGLMLETELDREDQLEWIGMIRNSANQLLGLVNDLLEYSKIEDGALDLKKEPVSISELVQEGLQMYKMVAVSKSVKMHFEVPQFDLVAIADRSKLIYALGNLISNAIKFSESGKNIWVRATAKDETHFQIEVQDEGIGIPAELMPKLFDRYGAKHRFGTSGEKGTGLGLPISKRFIEAHEGKIDVESSEGVGTRFIITLPLKLECANV